MTYTWSAAGTQALWAHVMGDSKKPAGRLEPDLPMENVSWDDITQPGGFLDRIPQSSVSGGRPGLFRLPTESEWEYASRGGPHWRDGFPYSGSGNIDAVAWYDRRHGDRTEPVRQKAPNQLGLYDMSGNVWEWCQDFYISDVNRIPTDGSAQCSAEAVFTTGPCIARCRRDMRSHQTPMTAVSGFALCSKGSRMGANQTSFSL